MMNTERRGIDRISSLPDDILTYILSFLSTRQAVQTCILSKRWTNTWASVPVLEFDIDELMPKIFDAKMTVKFVTKFELLVKSVLEKRDTSCVISRFHLWFGYGEVYLPCTQVVADCISDAMKLKPQECSMKLCLYANLNLNTNMIFTCASLIHLKLWVYTHVATEPNSINLPCLKSLDLTSEVSGDFFKKLLLGCPVLDELVLSSSKGIIEICSNTLKKLVINDLYKGNRLHISTPNLLYIEICIMDIINMGEILLLNMPSLVDAFITIPGWYDEDEYVSGAPKLIASLSNLESLKLEFYCTDKKVLSLQKSAILLLFLIHFVRIF
ncbi:F-box/FBD/LRR-repeat protein At1g16930-like [Carex rostrata]